MARFRQIDVHVTAGPVEFTTADLPTTPFVPFAMVWYSLRGAKQDDALRLDLDKQVFLDHFEDEEVEENIQKAAHKVAEALSSHLSLE